MVNPPLKQNVKKILRKEAKGNLAPSVSFLNLYQFATRWEKFILVIGFLACSITGFGQVVNGLNFCELADAMITYNNLNETLESDKDTFKDAIQRFLISDSLVVLAYLIFRYVALIAFNYVACNQVLRMRGLLFKSMMNWDVSWYDTNNGGELASRINEDLARIEDGIGEKVPMYFNFVMAFFFAVIISFMHGWVLTLACIIPSVFALAILFYFSSGTARLAKGALGAHAQAGAVAEEVFSAIRTVQAFDGKDKEIERYKQQVDNAEDISKKREVYSALFNGLQWGLFSLLNGWGAWFGIKLIVRERYWDPDEIVYTPRTMLIIYYSLSIAISHLSLSAVFVESFAIAKAAGAKVLLLIKQGASINPLANCGLRPATCKGNVSFQNINFHYPTRPDIKILKEFSLNIRSGEVVAIVGHSGCGKSTCIQLLQRLYDTCEGSILLDGIELKTLNVNWLRERIGVVGQEPVLFGTTIYENIRYGRLDATQKEIEEAARIANAHDFITMLPQGYNTQVGERGAQLSGGQKQRIAIARALIRNPDILLLDEATSALDVKNEAKVQVALERASQGRTTIIVAHRLSTIRNAHKIVVLDKGRVAEMGSHNELMMDHGVYYNMVTNQVNNESEFVNSPESPLIITDLDFTDDDEVATVIEKKDDDQVVVDDEVAKIKPATTLQIFKMHPSDWPYLLVGGIAALLGGIAIPVYSFVFGGFIGSLAGQTDDDLMNSARDFAYYWLGIGSATGISLFLQSYLLGRAGESLTKHVRQTCFKSIISQEIGWFDDKKNGTGMLCARLSGETADLHQATGSRVGNALLALGMLAAAFAISLAYKWEMSFIALGFMPFIYFFMWGEKKSRHRENMMKTEALGLSTKLVVEVVSNIRTVIALGRQQLFYEKYMEILHPAAKRQKLNIHIRGICYALTTSLTTIIYMPLMVYGCYLVLERELSFGDAIKTARAWSSAAVMMSNHIAYTPNVQRGLLAAARIFKLLNRQPKIMDADQIYRNTKHESQGNVKFDAVEFSYPTAPETNILRDLDLDVSQGQNIALVGPSGCGKSTCIQLLQRFYDVDGGQVSIDEQDVRSIPLRNLRLELGIVSQEASLFNRTIGENIAYGDNTRQVSFQEIIEAGKKSNIHNFIISLPEGYETKVGDKGTQLSGGQKQRIAIARALIRNPKILLLDEATSALDIESEKVVQAALDIAKKGRTCITIAHRLATIMDADVIYVMKDGGIVESGSHRELLEKRGIYYELYRSQRNKKS